MMNKEVFFFLVCFCSLISVVLDFFFPPFWNKRTIGRSNVDRIILWTRGRIFLDGVRVNAVLN